MRRELRPVLRHQRPRRHQRVIERPFQVIGVISVRTHCQSRQRTKIESPCERVDTRFVVVRGTGVAETGIDLLMDGARGNASLPWQVVSDAKEKRIGAGIGSFLRPLRQELRYDALGASMLIAAIQVETRNSIGGSCRKRSSCSLPSACAP